MIYTLQNKFLSAFQKMDFTKRGETFFGKCKWHFMEDLTKKIKNLYIAWLKSELWDTFIQCASISFFLIQVV